MSIQNQELTPLRPIRAIVDRGYRGRQQVEGTEVSLPRRPKPGQSKSTSTRMRARFRRRAAIEPLPTIEILLFFDVAV
jgi:IS5 family transposase